MGEVVKLTSPELLCPDNAAMAEQLRGMARDVEEGKYGSVCTLVLVVEADDRALQRTYANRRPIDIARLVGLLHIAALRSAEESVHG